MRILQFLFLFQKRQVLVFCILTLGWVFCAHANSEQPHVPPIFPLPLPKKEFNQLPFSPSRLLPYWDRYEGASKQGAKKKTRKSAVYANKMPIELKSLKKDEVGFRVL